MNSRLKVVVAERELQERRQLGIRTIASESGASISTVQRLLNNTIRRVPLDDLAALCGYFQCDISDILRLDDTAAQQPAARQ